MSPLVDPLVVPVVSNFTKPGSIIPVRQAWSSTDASAPVALSTSNRILTADTKEAGVYATTSSVLTLADLCYLSFFIESPVTSDAAAGLWMDGTTDMTSGSNFEVGQYNYTVGVRPGGDVYHSNIIIGNVGAHNDIRIMMAVRVSDRRVWVRGAAADGSSLSAWLGGGDPRTNDTPTTTLADTGGAMRAAAFITKAAAAGRSVEIHTNQGLTVGPIPGGGFVAANWGPP